MGDHAKGVKRKYDLEHPTLWCRIDPETHNEVLIYAKKEYISRAEAVRRLIEWGLETLKDEASSRKVERPFGERSSEPPSSLHQPPKRDRVHPSSRVFQLQSRKCD